MENPQDEGDIGYLIPEIDDWTDGEIGLTQRHWSRNMRPGRLTARTRVVRRRR
jgi:hypothetical protein